MSRHNRKRTRSRHRNRKSNGNEFQGLCSNLADTPSAFASPISFQTSSDIRRSRHSSWQTDKLPHQLPIYTLDVSRAKHVEATRIRIFGGEMGDGVSLCHPMLDVVRSLFDGDLDYADP